VVPRNGNLADDRGQAAVDRRHPMAQFGAGVPATSLPPASEPSGARHSAGAFAAAGLGFVK
jgi:hypothetical protein